MINHLQFITFHSALNFRLRSVCGVLYTLICLNTFYLFAVYGLDQMIKAENNYKIFIISLYSIKLWIIKHKHECIDVKNSAQPAHRSPAIHHHHPHSSSSFITPMPKLLKPTENENIYVNNCSNLWKYNSPCLCEGWLSNM